jgi:hypothetical protein
MFGVLSLGSDQNKYSNFEHLSQLSNRFQALEAPFYYQNGPSKKKHSFNLLAPNNTLDSYADGQYK